MFQKSYPTLPPKDHVGFHFYNGFYDNNMDCNMEGFIMKYGNGENRTLDFKTGRMTIEGDFFLPQGDFSIIPPEKAIKCGNTTLKFPPIDFSGPPQEHVVFLYIIYF